MTQSCVHLQRPQGWNLHYNIRLYSFTLHYRLIRLTVSNFHALHVSDGQTE